jgi:hypothetical protein
MQNIEWIFFVTRGQSPSTSNRTLFIVCLINIFYSQILLESPIVFTNYSYYNFIFRNLIFYNNSILILRLGNE